ncbi:MAG: hypothetical protein VXW32_10500 [Myxococcota bacterium]|nr:hypothetical protein [Myxococcota bacterium]
MIPLPTESQLDALAAALDEATHQERLDWLRGLNKKQQAVLFELAEGTQMDLTEVHSSEGQTVIQHGKNSLPMFTHFQKRIALHQGVVQGYNHQSLQWLVGPGHFRVVPHEVPGELLFDYLWTPESVPEGFPAARSNRGGLSTMVYGNLQDVVRKVSSHVSIGRALMKGKLTNNYFGLCREDAS